MPNIIKHRMRTEFESEFSSLDNFFFVDYRGMNSSETVAVREAMREEQISFRVVRNSIVERVLGDRFNGHGEAFLQGPTAVCYGEECDPVAVAKCITGWAKKIEPLEVKGGVLGDQALDADAVGRLAQIASRPELLAQLMAGIQAPLSGLVRCLQGPLTGMARILAAVRDQKEENG